MTTANTERIAEMRLQNYSYSFIGRVLNLSPNTVKSICRRQGFPANGFHGVGRQIQHLPYETVGIVLQPHFCDALGVCCSHFLASFQSR